MGTNDLGTDGLGVLLDGVAANITCQNGIKMGTRNGHLHIDGGIHVLSVCVGHIHKLIAGIKGGQVVPASEFVRLLTTTTRRRIIGLLAVANYMIESTSRNINNKGRKNTRSRSPQTKSLKSRS